MKKVTKRLIAYLLVFGLLFTNLTFGFFLAVNANASQKIILDTGEINHEDIVQFFDGEQYMGEMEIRLGGEKLATTGGEFVLPEFTDPYEVDFVFSIDGNFELKDFLVNGEKVVESIPGDFIIHYNIENNESFNVDVQFASLDHGGGHPSNNHGGFEILAEFDGILSPVLIDQFNNITIPSNFEGGDVSFKVKVCESNGDIIADNEHNECDPDTERLEPLHVEGIISKGEPREIFLVSEDRFVLTIKSEFFNYGRAGVHLSHDSYNDLNFFVNLTTEDLIIIRADAELSFIFDVGSELSAEAFLTNNVNEGDVSIFFGNNRVSLSAMGESVDKITNLVTGNGVVTPDGTVDINLPPLSVETTTKVTIEILLLDETKVTKDINIIRTAFKLHNYPDHGRVEASYIVNKAYLYENQNHNDEIFDAYLQVIFYKGDKIIGYKQVQIDDEDFVNGLEANESAEMFAGFGNIVLYDAQLDVNIKNPTKIAAFLTNGKIKYGDKLPSVEFGIGSGVVLELGGK